MSFEDDVRVARATHPRRMSISGGSEASSEHSIKQRKKAEPVKSACVQCQKRKTKCSGERPICRFCSDRDLTCSWDIGDGMTRTADLKQKLVDATGRGDVLTQQLMDEGVITEELRARLGSATDRSDDLDTVMEVLRSGTDQASTMMLARLRMGASIEDLVAPLRAAASESPQQSSSRSARYVAYKSSIVANVSDCPRAGSRSSSSSPAIMSPPPTSSQTFAQLRRDSHRPNEAWQYSPLDSQARSRNNSTFFGADGLQRTQSRHGSITANFETSDSPIANPFQANGLDTWETNAYPGNFSTPHYNCTPNQLQGDPAPVAVNPSGASAPRVNLPIRPSKNFKTGV